MGKIHVDLIILVEMMNFAVLRYLSISKYTLTDPIAIKMKIFLGVGTNKKGCM